MSIEINPTGTTIIGITDEFLRNCKRIKRSYYTKVTEEVSPYFLQHFCWPEVSLVSANKTSEGLNITVRNNTTNEEIHFEGIDVDRLEWPDKFDKLSMQYLDLDLEKKNE